MRIKVLKFFGPIISASLVYALFVKSFPSIGECSMILLAIVPLLFICSFLFGWALLKVRRYLLGLSITTILVVVVLLFAYPVTCVDSPFSTIRRMVSILSNKSLVTFSDQLQYEDREKQVASFKKFKRELSPDKAYEIRVENTVTNNSVLNTIAYLKDGKVFCIDTVQFKKAAYNRLYTMIDRDTLSIYFQGLYIDTTKMAINESAYTVSDDYENYYSRHTQDLALYITYEKNPSFYQDYWAYHLFYWVY